MKETVTVDKEMLMKLLRACAENYGFEICEFCMANRGDYCMHIRDKAFHGCADEVFKKLTEVK